MEALLWRRAVAGPVRPRGTPMTSRHGDPVGARLRQFYAALIDERRLGARRSLFAHAVGKAEQLLFALRRRADDDQDALLGVFKTGLQVNAVGPHVDVALGRQIALLPMLVLVEPDLPSAGRWSKPTDPAHPCPAGRQASPQNRRSRCPLGKGLGSAPSSVNRSSW